MRVPAEILFDFGTKEIFQKEIKSKIKLSNFVEEPIKQSLRKRVSVEWTSSLYLENCKSRTQEHRPQEDTYFD